MLTLLFLCSSSLQLPLQAQRASLPFCKVGGVDSALGTRNACAVVTSQVGSRSQAEATVLAGAYADLVAFISLANAAGAAINKPAPSRMPIAVLHGPLRLRLSGEKRRGRCAVDKGHVYPEISISMPMLSRHFLSACLSVREELGSRERCTFCPSASWPGPLCM